MAEGRKNKKAGQEDESISLNKYISNTGFCSRRDADMYIEQGRVTINGKDARKGNRVSPADMVEVDGEPLRKHVKTVYIAFHKPAGVTSTTDTRDKTNIISYINFPQRIFPIGRLDKDSEGLIFLTNDGNIVNSILRAGNRHEKEYIVTVDKPVTTSFIKDMGAGVRILGKRTLPCKVVQEGKFVFRITLVQGLNRQIRRMCEVLGYKVGRLVRIRIMNVKLDRLPPGHWRYLTQEEIRKIREMITDTNQNKAVTAPISEIPKQADKPAPPRKPLPQKKETDPKPSKKKRSYKEFRKRMH